ncbi:MAG: hypothetical protein AB1938_14030 [Myxococcota bacterium]
MLAGGVAASSRIDFRRTTPRRDYGRSVYRLRRPSPSGATALVLTAAELVRRDESFTA